MAGPGRPRLTASPTGRGTRSDILASAARLFATEGFAATTRAIAEGAGIRQATLYHYFANRDALLDALLTITVHPTLQVAQTLATHPGAPAARLWAMAVWDSRQLSESDTNLGALYLLPEVQREEHSAFRRSWQDLRDSYGRLALTCRTGQTGDDPTALGQLAIGLVESIINERGRSDTSRTAAGPDEIADAVVVLATQAPVTEATRAEGRSILATLPVQAGDPTRGLPADD